MAVTHSSREIKEGVQYQGISEEIIYGIDVTAWGSSPTGVSMVVTNAISGADVTSTVTSGLISVVGNIIYLKKIAALTAEITYRVDVEFTCGDNTFETYFYIIGEN